MEKKENREIKRQTPILIDDNDFNGFNTLQID